MNRHLALAVAASLALTAVAFAQTQTTPAPGSTDAVTPGRVTPAPADPSTTTPGTLTPSPSTTGTQPGSDDSTSPSSASSPHQRDATGKTNTEEATSASGANPTDASSPHQRNSTRMAKGATGVTAGMGVQTTAGEAIGTVKDVVPNASGQPGYVLITTPSGGRAAVPYATVSSMTHNGKIVLDRSRLEGAPQVRDSQLQDPANTQWQRQADQYWNGKGSSRSASPGKSATSSSPDDQG